MSMLAAATLLSWGASSLWVYRIAIADTDRLFDSALDHTAHAVLAVVRNEASELSESKEGYGFELGVIDQSDQNDIVYQVRGPNGIMAFRSHGSPTEALAGPRDRGFSNTRVGGEGYRVFTLATELDAAIIHVGQPMARRVALTRAGAVRLLAPGAALMVALVLAVAWTVRSTTAPLVNYARALDRLMPESGDTVDGSALPKELFPVSRAIDGLLARVRDTLLRERTLTADAAHELRTPLTALRLQAQVARRSKNRAEIDDALAELLKGVDRAARMVDSVLSLARFDAQSGPLGAETIVAGRLARLVKDEFVPLADARGIRISLTADGAVMLGNEDAIAIALRNLLGNALRFARARIDVAVTGDAERVVIGVRDDGPGFSEESKQRAFHRFFRGSEADHPSEGAGLGLALVLRIVELHRGSVYVVPGLEGGAGVEMAFARASGS